MPIFFRQLRLFVRIVRNELVKRRIDEPNGDREAVHRLEDADEIPPLKRQKLFRGLCDRASTSSAGIIS